MQVINENKKAKLITGEIINFYLVGKSEDDYPFEKNITYVGQGYLFENIKDDEIYHFWIFNKNYSVFDIQKGDKILVKINNESIWVVMSELIGNSGTAHCLYTDGSNVNIPFRDIDILYVEEGNTGLSIIKSAMAKEALLKGGFHLITYVNTFDEMPLKKGDYITAGDGYCKIFLSKNNLLKINFFLTKIFRIFADRNTKAYRMNTCIYCNTDKIHPKRIEILRSKNQQITCIECAEGKTPKVTGFQVHHDKACREIQVCTPEEGTRLMKLQRKTGGATGGPGFGPKAGKVVYKG